MFVNHYSIGASPPLLPTRMAPITPQPSSAAQPAKQYCVVTGLPVRQLPDHLLAGPWYVKCFPKIKERPKKKTQHNSTQLTGVLYCGQVKKAVQRWSYWHSRAVIITWNRLLVVDDEGQVRRFHTIEAIKAAKVERVANVDALDGCSVRMLIQLSNATDILLEFPEQESFGQFSYVLQCVHATLPLSRYSISDMDPSMSLYSIPGNSVSSRQSASGSSAANDPSKVAKLKTHLRNFSTPPLLPQQVVESEIDKDRRELETLSYDVVCPHTSLQYCVPPPSFDDNKMPSSLHLLYACDQVTMPKQAKKQYRRFTILVTYQKLILCDPKSDTVEQMEDMSDVHAVQFCTDDDSVLVRVDMGGHTRDFSLRFCTGTFANRLMQVISTIREVQQRDDDTSTPWGGVSLATRDAVLSPFVPEAWRNPRLSLSFVQGTAPLQQLQEEEEEAAYSDSEDALRAERIREWELQLHEGAALEAPVVAPLPSAARHHDACDCTPAAHKEGCCESSSASGVPVTVPCDPSDCSTCGSIARQFSYSAARKRSTGTASGGGGDDKRSAPTTGHVSRSESGCLSRGSGSRGSLHGSNNAQAGLKEVRQKIVDLKVARQAQSDSLDSLIAKVNASLTK